MGKHTGAGFFINYLVAQRVPAVLWDDTACGGSVKEFSQNGLQALA